MSQRYDTIIIGAGIAGCSTAYALQQKGQKVLLMDRSGAAASGGSGAAGAFVSPKIGKGGPLQQLTNEAFLFAKDFYLGQFPGFFHQTGVIRIPKDAEDAQKFSLYESHNDCRYRWVCKDELHRMGIQNSEESFLFEEAGVCDAAELCAAIMEHVPGVQYDVKSLSFEGGMWRTDKYSSKNIVLATGYQNTLFDMRYMGVKGTWGSRGDYMSRLGLEVSMHKKISISANINGIIKIGATHVKSEEPCRLCEGEPLKKLFAEASEMVDTGDFILKEIFCGMRAGSKDYFPLVGKVIDVPYMLDTYPAIVRGAKPEVKYIENLFICNGLGGRGFVFGPLMGKMLADLITEGKAVDSRVNPDRLFLKWCRKSPDLNRR
ncbi:MAG: FAD-dependent oxidoreductase [Sulfurimonas sp.]